MDKEGRFTFRKPIEVPVQTSVLIHTPERIGAAPGMIVTCADLYAPSGNGGTIYVGWATVTSIPKMQAGVELDAGDVASWMSPKKGDDGNPEKFDLYDLWITGRVDKDAVMVITW